MVLAALAVIFACGCTKDNENNGGGSYQTKIIGEWNLTKAIFYLYDASGTTIIDESEHNGETLYGWEFNNRFKFTSEGMVIMDNSWWREYDVIATYILEDVNLTISYTDDKLRWTIKELTNTTMVCEEECSHGDERQVRRYYFEKAN